MKKKRITFANDAERKAHKAAKDKARQSTPEFRAKQNAVRKSSSFKAKRNAHRRAELRLKAAAEGREVRVWRLTPEERSLAQKKYWQNFKQAHGDEHRVIDMERHRQIRAAKAVASGRPIGRVGRVRVLTDEQRLARSRAKSRAYWDKMTEEEKYICYKTSYEKNIETKRNYTREHKEEISAIKRTRRARKLGNGGKHTASDVRKLFSIQNGKCAWCAELLPDTGNHVDHWIPLAKGGSNDKSNLRLLHKKCNLSKGTKDPRKIERFNVTKAA